MERFIAFCDERDEAHYERIRHDPEWQRIADFIRRDFWHVTSLEGWQRIRETKVIKPNTAGRFKKRFDHVAERSYAYKHNLVALFDFVAPGDRELMRQWGNSWDVLIHPQNDQILLQLGRVLLEPRILPNSASWDRIRCTSVDGCIPFVEAWYPDEIPIDAIVGIYRIPATTEYEFCPVPISSQQTSE